MGEANAQLGKILDVLKQIANKPGLAWANI